MRVLSRPIAEPSLARATAVLARMRLRVLRNTFRHGSLAVKVGVVLLTLLLLAGGAGLWWLMRALIGAVGGRVDLLSYVTLAPVVAFTFFTTLIFITSLSGALSTLYLARDLDMLLVAPLPTRAVFLVKFFGNLAVPYLLLFTLVGPALVGFGQGLGAGPVYFLAAGLILFLLPLAPAGLATLLIMVVVRVLPAARVRSILAVLGAMIGALWFLASQTLGYIMPTLASLGAEDQTRRVLALPLPSIWAGRALVAAGLGEWGPLLTLGAAFALVSLGVFVGCVLAAERLYALGWAASDTAGTHSRRSGSRPVAVTAAPTRRGLTAWLNGWLPAPAVAIVVKDLRVVPRDPRLAQQFLFPLIVSVIWTIQLVSGGRPGGGGGPAALAALPALGPAGIAFFLGMTFSSTLGGSGISREGRHYWLLKIAPISAWEILRAKLVLAYLPFPLLAGPAALALALLARATPGDATRALALVLLAGFGTASLSMGLGAAFPRLDWDDPRRQTTLRASLLTLGLTAFYLGSVVGAAFGLPLLGSLLPRIAGLLVVGGWIVAIGLTVAVAWAALMVGATRLARLEV